ncbi:flagellin [Sinorhizobium fredii]|uniref:flagellin N-terminal helical domain-containing protein n=3 Tax=Rhizobium fredii TaxID=380 RepID=UPI00129813DA|nr:flagellin [Sinorhizobium fredii]MQW97416.1 flagellin/flagellar hook associated protein [Sinorhizobium fredii]UTY46669.1 flagellin/flagellar hook associated protein [Sinorhizobium fredii]
MTSILTNSSALAALQTLRSINSNLAETQSRVSSGLRVAVAADNAAYWSISTTMRSDNMAISAVSDALALGAAKVDVAYSGVNAVIDVLNEFKAKLIAAEEEGVDKAKIQVELNQLKEQVQSIATSASFSGANWLNTDIDDIYDRTLNRASTISSFTRDAAGGVSVKTMDVNLSEVALFNSTGGGLLQADPRDLGTIGGLRFSTSSDAMSTYSAGNTSGSAPSDNIFTFSGPLTFGVGDQISFDVTIDADNPADGILAPYYLGQTTSIAIDRATVDAVLPSANGVISTYKQYASVLSYALSGSGATATTYWKYDPPNQTKIKVDIPDLVGIVYIGNATLDGSSIQITGLTSTVGSGGLASTSVDYGVRSSSMTLDFEEFEVFEDVVVSFSLRVDNESSVSYSFDKAYVNSLLGAEDGVVATSADMATLLNSLIARPDVIIEATDGSTVSVRTDPAIDRKSGQKSGIGFWGIKVNIEPIPKMNFLEIDIERNPDTVGSYITYIETVTGRIIDAAAVLGAIGKRIDMRSEFASKLMATVDTGIGRLVDADMDEESTRLKALQTQAQLAVQALQIANSDSQNILQLFR